MTNRRTVPSPLLHCHVCGRILDLDELRMKEKCGNPKCQVYDIEFNVMMKMVGPAQGHFIEIEEPA